MARVTGIAESLDARLKRSVAEHGLEIRALAGRTLVEGILRHWRHGMGPSPIELKGGLLFDQTVRPTSDADFTATRSFLRHEIHRGVLIIRSLLQTEGMDIEFLSDGPQVKDVGHGDPVERWVVKGRVGGVLAETRLDISVCCGRDAFSRVSEVSEIRTLIKGLPSLTINTQPLEAAAAEKLLAVINQPDTDMRVKHVADILDERLWEGINCGDIAREFQRVCRHRGIDTTSLPDTLAVETYERLRENWTKHFRPGTPTVGFDQAISNVDYLWSEVQDCMTPSLRPLPTSAPVVAERRVGGMR